MNLHPLSVMVWAELGLLALKSESYVSWVNKNYHKYCDYLTKNNIILDIKIIFVMNGYDSRTIHHLIYLNILPKFSLIKSQETLYGLSSMEFDEGQIMWSKIHRCYTILNILSVAWSSISEEMIHSFYSSFFVLC